MSLNEAECYDAIDDLVDKHIKSGSFLYSMVLILTVFTEYSGILYGDLNIGSYLGKAFTFRLFTCTTFVSGYLLSSSKYITKIVFCVSIISIIRLIDSFL
ncbi:9135_t:CDS:2, partial [Funneliformis geosporum]